MNLNDRTKRILFWLAVIGIIVSSGVACQYVLTVYPLPHVVVVKSNMLISSNLSAVNLSHV